MITSRTLGSNARARTWLKALCLLLGNATIATLFACGASYRTPGGPAAIGAMTTASVADQLKTVPEAQLPAIIAFTRVQDSGYRSRYDGGVNRGSVALVGPRELERDDDAKTMAAWSEVREVVRITPILVAATGDPLMALREGAAALHADVLALYTVDTTFRVDDSDFGPLGLISLGMAPTRSAQVHSSVSMAFFDVRTGFCYGTAEGSANDDQLANAWTSDNAVDQCRLRVERKAFEAMLLEAGKTWAAAAASRKAALGG